MLAARDFLFASGPPSALAVPTSGALQFVGSVPDLYTGAVVYPTSGALALVGSVPEIVNILGSIVFPTSGDLAFVGAVPVVSTSTPVPTFDAVSSTVYTSYTNNSAGSISIDAAAEADIFVLYGNGGNVSPSNIQCNGTAMAAVSGAVVAFGNNAGAGWLRLYRAPKAGTGSSVNITFQTPPAAVGNTVTAISYVGVNTVSGVEVSAAAAASPYVVGPLSCASGQRRVAFLGCGSNVNGIATTPSTGGNLRYSTGNNGNNINVSICDTTVDQVSYSTVIANANNPWAEIDLLLS